MKPKSKSQTGFGSQKSPLKVVKWLFRPKPSPKTIDNLKPIRKSAGISPFIRERLNPIELIKALQGEMTDEYHGVVRLYFDVGIQNEIESLAQSLKDRRYQTVTDPQKMGWGGQLAYSHYLNFFFPRLLFYS